MENKQKCSKFSCSLRGDLAEFVDQKAATFGISRSGYIAMCVSQVKQAEEEKPRIYALMESFSGLVNGYVDGSLPPDVAQVRLQELEAAFPEIKK